MRLVTGHRAKFFRANMNISYVTPIMKWQLYP